MNETLLSVLMVNDFNLYRNDTGKRFVEAGFDFVGYTNFEVMIEFLDDLLKKGLGFGIIDGNQEVYGDGVADGIHTVKIIRERSGVLAVKCPVLIGNSYKREVPGADYQYLGNKPEELVELVKSIQSVR